LHKVAAHMGELKARGQAHATGLLMALGGALPAPVGALLGRMLPSWPMINVVCTNVPGPREPRFILGRRIVSMHPVVPLFEGLGLGFAILSYADQLSTGVTADPNLVPDVNSIATAISDELDLLVAAAGLGVSPAPQPVAAAPRVADLMVTTLHTIGPL